MKFFVARVSVTSVRRLSPTFVRVEFVGDDLAGLVAGGPTWDQRIKLIFPGSGGTVPDLRGDDWWDRFRALPEDERGHMRTYTIRAFRDAGRRSVLVVDFAVHAATPGPGSGWALTAREGAEILAVLPDRIAPDGGVEWLSERAGTVLLAGDETAAPAVASIVESLRPDARGAAFVEVPDPADVQHLAAPAGLTVTWLVRGGAAPGTLLTPAVAAHAGLGGDAGGVDVRGVDPDLWETPTYSSSGEPVDDLRGEALEDHAWIAGEAGVVTGLRRVLVGGGVLQRRQVAFMGYWRIGAAMG